MSRRNTRVVMRWAFAILIGAGIAVACAPAPAADDNGPDTVRVQIYEDPRSPMSGKCLIFTHDTLQGASMAVVC